MPLRIDIVSDPVCPWCLVGLRRLNKALADWPEGELEIVHHPFLLDAKAPPEGEDVAAMLTRKYGRDPGPMWDRLESEAKGSGIDLDMRRQTMRYPSQKAQVLIAASRERGTQHALAIAIGDAYYFEARNISDDAVLVEIAGEHGFAEEEVRALIGDPEAIAAVERAAEQVAGQGIGGVPFFVFGGKYALNGAQPESVFAEALAATERDGAKLQ